jgi:voltage-gated potassium channel
MVIHAYRNLMQDKNIRREYLKKERYKFLYYSDRKLEMPMILLAALWLVFFLLFFQQMSLWFIVYFIWFLFLLEFLIKFLIAPKKGLFFKRHKLMFVALFFPALRVIRIYFHFKRKESIRKAKYLQHHKGH